MSAQQEGTVVSEVPVDGAATVQRPEVLGLLEALDRHGAVHASLKIHQWPVTVGRSLDADLVLDDPHIAARHLQIDALTADSVSAQVLETSNGARLGRKLQTRGSRFDWPSGQTLSLGRLQLRMRLAHAAIEPELALPASAWRETLLTLALLAAALLYLLAQAWLKSHETQKFLQEIPALLSTVMLGLAGWVGAWALATKLFSGQLQFWRHARIASLVFVVAGLLEAVSHLTAFSLSWENLSRFAYVLTILVVAAGVCAHLWVVAPTRRQGLAVGVLAAVLLGLPAMLATQWMRNQRLSNQLYMSVLFPPAWRLAEPVAPKQFLSEAASIEERLAKRLKRGEDDAEEDEDED